MTIHNLIKRYGSGKGEHVMWDAIKAISEYVEENCEDEQCECMKRKLYAMMNGNHYNDDFAKCRIEKLYSVDADGNEHYAPYWSDDEIESIFEDVKSLIPMPYNVYDFAVAMNMVKSDYGNLFTSWFGGNADKRIVEFVIAYLNDPDADDGKIWRLYE